MNSFLELQDKVKSTLNEDLRNNRIDPIKVMSVLYLLSPAKNEHELLELMRLFKDDYATLQTVLKSLEKAEKDDIEADLQLILSDLIKNNPSKASELAKLAADPTLSKKKLLKLFPEAKKYLK